ncbi:MAG: Asp-tRNA(Asn)/Glu-tRNA(Gln) amidotransferase subunit GatA [Nitrospirae bacterium]|nr:Asp-tRNA(Asn)/Glu-tRNA(Gln) amidotransferase subunit GatA [Nitrospirota bacterium]
MKPYEKNISECRDMLRSGEVSSVEITKSVLERIAEVDGRLNAFITVNGEAALAQAEAADRRRAGGESAPLLGIPLAIKDNLCTQGVRTTCASKILDNFIPPYESTATALLAKQGYVLVGKTNMDEFAMGSSTENSAFGPSKNPWNTECAPGGSSGGSAFAVAADECIAALGSDTGGSIRQPAAFCGVVGMKPTYGRVSRYGLVAFASSLDQIGPITKTVKDAAILLSAIAGPDSHDSTCAANPVADYEAAIGREIKGLKIGIPRQYFIEGMDAEVEGSVKSAIAQLESLGAVPVEIEMPHTDYAVATYYLIATSEASSNLARFDGVRYGARVKGDDLIDMYRKTRSAGFGAEVKRRIMLGTYALSSGYYDAYYLKAQKVRTLIKQDFDMAFKQVDVVVCPTSPMPPFRIGDKIDDPLQMYLADIFTIALNLAGGPGISVPCGFTSSGLPVGLQLMGRPFDEETLFSAAHAYEQSAGWTSRKPEVAA